jgi:hypothetical protein
MRANERAKLLWHGEGQHEVGAGQQTSLLMPKPVPSLITLATGAVAIATRLGPVMQPITLLAVEMDRACLGSAAAHQGLKSSDLIQRHAVTELFQVVGTELSQDIVDRPRAIIRICLPAS